MISLLCAALVVAPALVPGSTSGGGAMSVLTHSFGDQITSELGKTRVISYCPDNTCETFSAPASTPESSLADFALTYLFYASGYTYLDTFVSGEGEAQAHSILERNRGACSSGDQLQLASCVLLSLARRYSIRVTSVVFDEGARHETPVRLKTTVAVSQLRRTATWRSEQWRHEP